MFYQQQFTSKSSSSNTDQAMFTKLNNNICLAEFKNFLLIRKLRYHEVFCFLAAEGLVKTCRPPPPLFWNLILIGLTSDHGLSN